MTDDATIIAEIDTGKAKLDVALRPGGETVQVDNACTGHRDLLAFLTQHRLSTVGIEASGGYERTVLAALCAAGLHVVLLQPRQVRAFAQYKLRRAKNDRLDAGLIAECVVGLTARRAGFDTHLDLLGEALRRIEQIEADIVRAKTRRESFHDVRLCKAQTREIERLQRLLKAETKRLVAEVDAAPALAARLSLIKSVEGTGWHTAGANRSAEPTMRADRISHPRRGSKNVRVIGRPAGEAGQKCHIPLINKTIVPFIILRMFISPSEKKTLSGLEQNVTRMWRQTVRQLLESVHSLGNKPINALTHLGFQFRNLSCPHIPCYES